MPPPDSPDYNPRAYGTTWDDLGVLRHKAEMNGPNGPEEVRINPIGNATFGRNPGLEDVVRRKINNGEIDTSHRPSFFKAPGYGYTVGVDREDTKDLMEKHPSFIRWKEPPPPDESDDFY
jgi:hypothetical protein